MFNTLLFITQTFIDTCVAQPFIVISDEAFPRKIKKEEVDNMLKIEKIESEIEEINDAIVIHNKIVQKLVLQRYDLISQKLDLEMEETLECAIENDISPRRVMDLIIAEVEERNKRWELKTAC